MKIEEIEKLPEKIGIYIFKDKNNKVIYIGKSVNIKKRIKQHFKSQSLKIIKLINETQSIEVLELNSEVEAILKEAELIKKFDPPYNNILKDDTRYFYIVFTNDQYQKILITHQPQKYHPLTVIGPFVEGSSLKTILKIIRKEIPFCTCLKKHKSSCLNSLIGLCYGWCCKENEKGDVNLYNQNINRIKEILRGNFKKLKIKLLNKLENLINEERIEEANKVKKEIIALNKLINHTGLIQETDTVQDYLKASKELKNLLNLNKLPTIIEAYDISHWAGKEKVGICAVFKDGEYLKNSLKKFIIKLTKRPNDPQMIYEVLSRRLRHKEWIFPDVILIDGGKAQFNYALKAIKNQNLENYVKIISIAKPTEKIFYQENKKPIDLNKLSPELQRLIKFIDKKTHQLVIAYHRRRREKLVK